MKVKFIVDRPYLAYHILHNDDKGSQSVVAFQTFAWGISRDSYALFAGKDPRLFPSRIGTAARRLPSFLQIIVKSNHFAKVLNETEIYAKHCENQWKKNFQDSFKIVKELTGLKLNKDFEVYVTHPSLRNGKHWGRNVISWGHLEDWPNYTTVYLWHEILHSYLKPTDRNHAIIQFVTDNELKIRLNGGKYPPFEGHKRLFPLMKQMLPYWRKYLKSKDKNIMKFQKQLPKSIPINIA